MGTIRWRATERWQWAFRAWILQVFAAWLVCPFWASGTIGWVPGWLYLGVLAGVLVAHGRYVARWSPEIRRRRRTIGEGTEGWDIGWNFVFWPLMAAIAVAAGRDHAVHGATLPVAAWPAGAALLAAGMSLSARAMVANPFFEGTVRIQHEVGHRVIDVGPYRLVRHPGYIALVAWAAATPLLLLSVRALAVSAVVAGWIALRTALEDATLRRELPGYGEYARRVPYRLVPGLW